MPQPSYIRNVSKAIQAVKTKYPGAVVYAIDGSTFNGAVTTDPRSITRLRVVFGYNESTILLYSHETWGEWENPQKINHLVAGDRAIPWLIEYEIVDAYKAVCEAGYTQPFESVTLRWPLASNETEPSYIFGFGDGTFMFVSCYQHRVHKVST